MLTNNNALEFYCPLLKIIIPYEYCYEINSVAFGLCKPSLINDITDKQTAKPVCKKCANKQMSA
jgi:hypothetical protein